jgi:Deoxyribonuclease NucA/NucB
LTSCDEYPFASTLEGGAGASIAPVPVSEQNSQGGTLSSFYQQNNVPIGGKFFVATGP